MRTIDLGSDDNNSTVVRWTDSPNGYGPIQIITWEKWKPYPMIMYITHLQPIFFSFDHSNIACIMGPPQTGFRIICIGFTTCIKSSCDDAVCVAFHNDSHRDITGGPEGFLSQESPLNYPRVP